MIAALLALEVLVTATDEFVENRTRVLPQNERVLHVFLTLNYGLIVALLVPTLWRWGQEPAALAWSVRDLLAWRRLSAAPGGAASA